MGEPEGGAADGTGVRLEADQAAPAALRDHFMGWQCRLRQMAVRQAGGRPTSGMRPEVRLAAGDRPLGAITTLIVRREPREATAQFRHLVRKTQDPAERHDAALETLAAAYYQRPQAFSDELTALFGPASDLADQLLAAGRTARSARRRTLAAAGSRPRPASRARRRGARRGHASCAPGGRTGRSPRAARGARSAS